MPRRNPPTCPRCRQPMKRILYGLPGKDYFENPDIILGGCIMGPFNPEWDCKCETIPNREVKFEIFVADITTLNVDAMVNAANPQLLAGGGVCGAIHDAAGPALEAECLRKYPYGIDPGMAVFTKGFNSKAKWIIHAVAPRFNPEGRWPLLTLLTAYRNALLEADKLGAKTIAMPSLGTGIYGWDVAKVAPEVIQTIKETLPELGNLETVTLCCFTEADALIYRQFV